MVRLWEISTDSRQAFVAFTLAGGHPYLNAHDLKVGQSLSNYQVQGVSIVGAN